MSSVTLRDYQQTSVDLVLLALKNREHPLCVLPTGGGKSLVLAEVARRSGQRILVISHLKELLAQDSQALRQLDPGLPQSFFSAGMKEKRGGAQVVFASVQTLARALDRVGSRSLLLIDEAHLCPRSSDAMYAKVFAHFSTALRAGFTATPKRLDSGSLIEGADAWFSSIAHQVEVEDLIKAQHLRPLVGVLTEHQANMTGVKSRAGDFMQEQAQGAVMRTLKLEEVIGDVVSLARRRSHWLVFAAGVEHAREVAEGFRARGVDTGLVLGETESAERDEQIARFKAGEIKALVSVGVLTTGFDAPQTDCIVCLRPTQSEVLWQQMLGRGMRVSAGKRNCLLLDFVGNLERLGGVGCVEAVQDRRDRTPGETRPIMTPAQLREAAERKVEFAEVSLADPMMKSGAAFAATVRCVRMVQVTSKRFPGKKMVLAIYDITDQQGATMQAQSFVNVEIPGGARAHAVRWFERRGVEESQVPNDARTALALAKVLPEPREVDAYWDPARKRYMVSEERF